MKIFDFFKKLTKKDDVEDIISEKLDFSDIENWIENQIKENEFKEQKVLFLIKEKIEDFIKGIREKIVVLESFDVESKKEKENIKNIVLDSREKYVDSVEDLIKKLNYLEESKLERFIHRINKIFFDFNKNSFKNYERTTILIGKEMASIKESLKSFSKELLRTHEENKEVVDFFKRISQIKSKHQDIVSSDKILESINEKKLNLNKKINDKEVENKILKQNLEEIKTSPIYLENLSKQKKIELLKENSKKEILELKQLLDFKALANFFHIFEEQMSIVKNHKENFQTNFEKDNGVAIVELLDKSKLNNSLILEKVNQIRIKKEEKENHEKSLEKDEAQEVFLKIEEICFEIDNLKIEHVKEEKRNEKVELNKKDLIDLLKKELYRMNVEVI